MRFRKLRIAGAVGGGLAAALLIALWGRGYWWGEGVCVPLNSKYYFGAASHPGCVGFAFHPMGQFSSSQIKRFQRDSAEGWLEVVRQERFPNISRVWGTFDFRRYSYIAPDWFVLIVLAT